MVASVEQRAGLNSAVTSFQAELDRNPVAQQYLAGRGYTPEVAARFRLGVVPEGAVGYEPYAGRLAIPYITPTGIVDIRFRSLNGADPKYLSRDGAKRHMYNVGAFQVDVDVLAICEGEIDCMTLEMAGVAAIGIPGANGWVPLWQRAFQDYARITVFCDGDDAGRDFGRRIKRDVDAAVSVHLPDGEDVNSMYVKYGADVIRERVYA